jgi:hypothetical protein
MKKCDIFLFYECIHFQSKILMYLLVDNVSLGNVLWQISEQWYGQNETENSTRTYIWQANVSDIVGAHKLQYTEESSIISASENIERQWGLCTYITCPVLDVPEIFAFVTYTKQSWQQTEPTRWSVILSGGEPVSIGIFDLHIDHGMSGNTIDSYVSRD